MCITIRGVIMKAVLIGKGHIIVLEEDQRRRFPKVKWFPERGGNESVYLDDGSERGERIVTFVSSYQDGKCLLGWY